MLKKVIVAVVICLVVVGACIGAHRQGITKGIEAYHRQCFEVGGFIMDEAGHVVACAPQGTIPKEELKNFKDNI